MPYINVKLVENVFDEKQKTELIEKITDAIDSVYPGLRDLTFVVIDETKEGNWGIGGKSINCPMVQEHAKKNLGK
ncbi:MAG: 4-oxalocrotonate tautomerase [Sulfurovum sp.]|nr:4-oxalocrotonate tautomerase [Sulfurovum sp.]